MKLTNKKVLLFLLLLVLAISLFSGCTESVGTKPTYDLNKDLIIYIDETQTVVWDDMYELELETGDFTVYIKNLTSVPIEVSVSDTSGTGISIHYVGYTLSSETVLIEPMELKPLTFSVIINPFTAPSNLPFYFLVNYQETSLGSGSIALSLLIGTGTLWLLTLIVVNPLAKHLTMKKLAIQAFGSELSEEEVNNIASNQYTKTFITTDIIVLGIAGFIMGATVGWYFIGISFSWRSWPGLIVFILASLAGSYLHGIY